MHRTADDHDPFLRFGRGIVYRARDREGARRDALGRDGEVAVRKRVAPPWPEVFFGTTWKRLMNSRPSGYAAELFFISQDHQHCVIALIEGAERQGRTLRYFTLVLKAPPPPER